jgi:hypothetical protein
LAKSKTCKLNRFELPELLPGDEDVRMKYANKAAENELKVLRGKKISMEQLRTTHQDLHSRHFDLSKFEERCVTSGRLNGSVIASGHEGLGEG